MPFKIITIFGFLFIPGFSEIISQPQEREIYFENNVKDKTGSAEVSISKIDSIIDFGKTFLNKPYKYKGPSPWPMDCSGYLAFIFSQFGYQLPHSSTAIGSVAEKIDKNDVRKGDVLFFKGRNVKNSSIGHVALVADVSDGIISMLHSCRRGIVLDEYPQTDYYRKRFIMAGRLTFLYDSMPPVVTIAAEINPTQKKTDSISIIGVGDMMLGTLYPAGFLPPDDGKDLLAPVKGILQNADVTFGNCEGGFLDKEAAGKKCDNPSLCYSFRQPERYVNYYADAGFDVLSIANNHVGDFGEEGRNKTVETLRKAKINFAGLVSCPYTTFEMKGVKYGFCAFAPNDGTVDLRDIEGAKKIVSHLDSISDIVIVSFHGGAEGSAHTHVKKYTELFHGENRGNVYEFAHAVIDAGADVVFGHGPHVTRAVDLYKNRFIIYSMGNFATYARFNLKGVNGIAPIMKVYVNKNGEFLKGKIFSVKQEGEGGPVPDSTGAIISEIISLTKADLPTVSLKIDNDGTILKSTKPIGK